MRYPRTDHLYALLRKIDLYSKLKHENGSNELDLIILELEKHLEGGLEKMKNANEDEDFALKEPNELDRIRKLRPKGPRRIWEHFDEKIYFEKLEGALVARMAGCTLGAIVEGWQIDKMQAWAKKCGDKFPPVDYWSDIPDPETLRYGMSKKSMYLRNHIKGVPVDDDVTYTLLGLLIAEEYGLNFSTEDVGKAWLKYLPYACTAEDIALKNLKKNIPFDQCGQTDNPYCLWIGADIRSDPWAYMAPGYPEEAARMAWVDAMISHRRTGVYGEMFFSAVQSAAFTTDNAVDALKIGLTEIPKECMLSKEISWALDEGKNIRDYKQARQAVDDRYFGMSGVHTVNNAVLTVFGLMIGQNDVTRVLSEIVAMGLDNDCTAATAGSIVGAIVGIKNIPMHWYEKFNNTVYSYMNGHPEFTIENLLLRFKNQAEKYFK